MKSEGKRKKEKEGKMKDYFKIDYFRYIKTFDTYFEYNFTSVPTEARKSKPIKEECCICFEKRDSVVLNACAHKVCNECVKKITTCPLCRAEITSYTSAVVAV